MLSRLLLGRSIVPRETRRPKGWRPRQHFSGLIPICCVFQDRHPGSFERIENLVLLPVTYRLSAETLPMMRTMLSTMPAAIRKEAADDERIAKPRISYSIAHEQEDLRAAFELTYLAYRRSDLAKPNPLEIRFTKYHLLPTTEVFVTKFEHSVVSTLSLIGDGQQGLPMDSIYPDQLDQFRQRGLRVAEIGCLADRRKSPARFIETFIAMASLAAKSAMQRQYHGLVVAVHPRHAKFYLRMMPFQQIGGLEACDYANGHPAVMLGLIFDEHRGSEVYRRFLGELGSPADVSPRPWTDETREYFSQLLQVCQGVACV